MAVCMGATAATANLNKPKHQRCQVPLFVRNLRINISIATQGLSFFKGRRSHWFCQKLRSAEALAMVTRQERNKAWTSMLASERGHK